MTARFFLFVVWFLGFATCLSLLFAFVAVGYTSFDALKSNLADLTAVFAPYLGTVIAFWFAQDLTGDRKPYNVMTFWVAMICSLFFNVVATLILVSVFFRNEGEGVIEQTLSLQKYFASICSFIVAPAVGFFFGKSETRKPRPRRPDGADLEK